MSANRNTAAPTGRKKTVQGREHSDAALGQASQNTSSPEGANEGGTFHNGWRTAPFGEVVDILDSRRIPVNSEERAKRIGDVPYYGATGQVGVIDKHIFDEELVLLGEDGAPFLDSGKPKAYLIRGKSWVNNHAHVLRGKPGLLNSFLLYQLNNLDYRPYVSGTTRLKLPQGPMKQIPLLVPPLPEQQRIVAEIEKQFTRLEAGVAALRRVQANLKRYRAAVLKAACEGRLVPTEAELARQRAASHPGGVRESSRGLSASDTPGNVSPQFIHPGGVAERVAGSGIPSGCGDSLDEVPGVSSRPALLNPRLLSGSPPGFSESAYETGAELLARILIERRQNWQGRGQYKEPAATDAADLPQIPDGWTWARAEQLCGFITKGTTPSAENMQSGQGEIPFIKVYNLTFTGVLNSDYKPVFISRKTHEDALARSEVRSGDILINIVGPPLGQVSIVPATIVEANINQAIARFRVVLPECRKLLGIWLMAEPIIAWAMKRAKTTAGQSNLTLEHCRDLPIPLPPLPEQTRIVAEVERRLSVVEELESVVTANLQRATRLRQSILQRAFNGRLI